MFYGNTIQDTRELFFSSWARYQQHAMLSGLEQQIVRVILDHPEYHALLNNQNKYQDTAYYPELGQTNPFLHMGLHLAVREQVTTDRPQGISAAFKHLLNQYKDPLDSEHLIMEQLAECLWLSQKNNVPPDDTAYLNRVRSF
jgi:hypothetical protein